MVYKRRYFRIQAPAEDVVPVCRARVKVVLHGVAVIAETGVEDRHQIVGLGRALQAAEYVHCDPPFMLFLLLLRDFLEFPHIISVSCY